MSASQTDPYSDADFKMVMPVGIMNASFRFCLLVVFLLHHIQISRSQCETPCEGLGSYSLRDEPLPKDCKDIQNRGLTKSGVYTIFPQDVYLCVSLRVYCDMETDGGGWTVFQRRYDNRFNFYLRWSDYRVGFGSLGSEFWLGNEHLYHITTQDDYLLRVDLEDFEGGKASATYAGFRLENEALNYRLHLGNFTGGEAGDSLSAHSGSSFSTSDSDVSGGSCPSFRGGAWWYPRLCGDSNLNGRYLPGVHTEYGEGVMWRSWRGLTYSLRRTELKFRPIVESDWDTIAQEVGSNTSDGEDNEDKGDAEEEGDGEKGDEGEEDKDESSYSSSSEPEDEPFKGTVKGSIQARKNKEDKGR